MEEQTALDQTKRFQIVVMVTVFCMVLGEYGQVGQHAPNRVELDQDLEQDNATIQLQSTEVTHALEPVLRHLLVMHIAAL